MARSKGHNNQTDPNYLGVFLAALRWRESGSPEGNYTEPNGQGAYQIVQGNWPAWAREAGYPQYANDPNASNAPASVQDAVATFKVKQYYNGAGQHSWRLVARIWNGGSPNPVPNPALCAGCTTDDYADQVLAHMATLAKDGSNLDHAPTWGGLKPPGNSTAAAPACTHDLKIALPAAPDIHLCMDKPIAALAIGAGGVLMIGAVAVILVATIEHTPAGRAATAALAVAVPAGRIAKATNARQAARSRSTAADTRSAAAEAAEARREAAEARRVEAHQAKMAAAAQRTRLAASRRGGRSIPGVGHEAHTDPVTARLRTNARAKAAREATAGSAPF